MRRTEGTPSLWRVVALGAILATTAFSMLADRLVVSHGSMAQITARYPSLFTPARYAFGIWILTFAGLIAYAVAALGPSERRRELHDRLAPLLVLASVLAAAWVLLFKLDLIIVSQAVMVLLLVVTGELYARTSHTVLAGELPVVWRVPFSLLLGGVLIATIANLHLTLRASGSDLPLSPPIVVATLALAVVVSVATARRHRDPVVPLVVSWASVAIAAAQRELAPVVAWAALIAGAVTSVGAIMAIAPAGGGRPTRSPPRAEGPPAGRFATRARRRRAAPARSAPARPTGGSRGARMARGDAGEVLGGNGRVFTVQ